MASLEGIRVPTRASSDAPAGLPCMQREAPSSTLAWGPRRARRAAAVRFADFWLRSLEARRGHDAAAVTIPPLTFNVRQSCTRRVGRCAVDVAQMAAAAMALAAEAYHTAAVQTAAHGAVRSQARCRDHPTGVTEPRNAITCEWSAALPSCRVG
jgi:hypothetical protein